jgi:hypothetical protein
MRKLQTNFQLNVVRISRSKHFAQELKFDALSRKNLKNVQANSGSSVTRSTIKMSRREQILYKLNEQPVDYL